MQPPVDRMTDAEIHEEYQVLASKLHVQEMLRALALRVEIIDRQQRAMQREAKAERRDN